MPKPIQPSTVEVPELFSVTALANDTECALQVVLRSNAPSTWPRLSPGPAALFGTMLHRLLAKEDAESESPKAVIAGCIADLASQLSVSFDFEPRDISSIVDPKTQARAIALLRNATTTRQTRPHAKQPSSASGIAPGIQELRLKGVPDELVDHEDGTLDVIEYKSGLVRDATGTIKRSIQIQVQLYALLQRHRHPHQRIRGFVDNGARFSIGTTDADLQHRISWLEARLAELPTPGTIEAIAIAKPGLACVGCAFRPGCAAYAAAAPRWWSEPPPFHVPFDTWGEVRSVSETNGITDLDLRDAAGRHTRVVRLGNRHISKRARAGDLVWLYGLRAIQTQRNRSGERLHPRVFRDLPMTSGGPPAWQARVFLSNDDLCASTA